MSAEREQVGIDQRPLRNMDETLLAWLWERKGVCHSYAEVWRQVWGHPTDFDFRRDNCLLRVHLFQARKLLREIMPGENFHLASVKKGYHTVILCQGEVGDLVPLPELLDLSKIPDRIRQDIACLTEVGVLRGNQMIQANFSPTEAKILLKLAQTPEAPVFRDILCLELPGQGSEREDVMPELRIYIHILRKKLAASPFRIMTKCWVSHKRGYERGYERGYALMGE